jgi:hypothetical protein
MSRMRIRAEVVRFLESQTMLTLAAATRDAAVADYRSADRECRRAWEALTKSEQAMVNEACADLNEPETARPWSPSEGQST